ncbi:uncharacterized protein LOC126905249 [Daktulosphaira vitifoliae]|uniref:uncharacterized protein LOC126905249 n=1 Tax=Daktulosphaira vitifoliae TaxID=58002 RepID=UPI0021AA1D15|nr:uncharacterized protein LOC126905249 [Daktulosphaira vitifoliae]
MDGQYKQTNKQLHSNSSNSQSDPSSPNTNLDTKENNKQIKKNLFATRNRFELLVQDDPFDSPTTVNISTNSLQYDAENNIMNNENTLIKSPSPIFVKGVEDFPALCTVLIELIGVDNFICKSSTNSLKIQTTDPTAYRTLVHYLKSEKAEYHTSSRRINHFNILLIYLKYMTFNMEIQHNYIDERHDSITAFFGRFFNMNTKFLSNDNKIYTNKNHLKYS